MERKRGASLIHLKLIALSIIIVTLGVILYLKFFLGVERGFTEENIKSRYIIEAYEDIIYHINNEDMSYNGYYDKDLIKDVGYNLVEEYDNSKQYTSENYNPEAGEVVDVSIDIINTLYYKLENTYLKFRNYGWIEVYKGNIVIDKNSNSYKKIQEESNAAYTIAHNAYNNSIKVLWVSIGIFLLLSLGLFIFKITPSNSVGIMFFVKFIGIPLNLILLLSGIAAFIGIIIEVLGYYTDVLMVGYAYIDSYFEAYAILAVEVLILYLILMFLVVIKEKIYYMLKDEKLRAEEWNRILVVKILKFIGGIFSFKNKKYNKILTVLKLMNSDDYIAPEAMIGIKKDIREELNVLNDKLKRKAKDNFKRIELDKEEIELKSLVKNSLESFYQEIEASDINFKINFPHEEVKLYGDYRKIKRVFNKIFYNTLKYSLGNTRVYIDMMQDDTIVQIEVKNIAKNEIELSKNEILEGDFITGKVSEDEEDQEETIKSHHGSSVQEEGVMESLEIKVKNNDKYVTFKRAKEIINSHGGDFDLEVDGDLFKVVIQMYKEV